MSEPQVVAVRGAADWEQDLIQIALDLFRIPVHQAMCAGSPVLSDSAYQADAVDPPLPDGDPIVWRIECDGPAFDDLPDERVVVIDHHRPGDPGYGRPPAEFWEASSLGQVLALLARRYGYSPEEVIRAIAAKAGEINLAIAADHCLADAYQGRCPGVDPDRLMEWRARLVSSRDGRPVEDVLADLGEARRCLREAVGEGRTVTVGELVLADLRGHIDSAEASPDKRAAYLTEASVREGIAFLTFVPSLKDGGTMLYLRANPLDLNRSILDLLEALAKGRLAAGLKGVHIDPTCGFVGGYFDS